MQSSYPQPAGEDNNSPHFSSDDIATEKAQHIEFFLSTLQGKAAPRPWMQTLSSRSAQEPQQPQQPKQQQPFGVSDSGEDPLLRFQHSCSSAVHSSEPLTPDQMFESPAQFCSISERVTSVNTCGSSSNNNNQQQQQPPSYQRIDWSPSPLLSQSVFLDGYLAGKHQEQLQQQQQPQTPPPSQAPVYLQPSDFGVGGGYVQQQPSTPTTGQQHSPVFQQFSNFNSSTISYSQPQQQQQPLQPQQQLPDFFGGRNDYLQQPPQFQPVLLQPTQLSSGYLSQQQPQQRTPPPVLQQPSQLGGYPHEQRPLSPVRLQPSGFEPTGYAHQPQQQTPPSPPPLVELQQPSQFVGVWPQEQRPLSPVHLQSSLFGDGGGGNGYFFQQPQHQQTQPPPVCQPRQLSPPNHCLLPSEINEFLDCQTPTPCSPTESQSAPQQQQQPPTNHSVANNHPRSSASSVGGGNLSSDQESLVTSQPLPYYDFPELDEDVLSNSHFLIDRAVRSFVDPDLPDNHLEAPTALTELDLRWVELLNHFNSVYRPASTAAENIHLLRTVLEPDAFTVFTTANGDHGFATIVEHRLMGEFYHADPDMDRSVALALFAVFEQLRLLVSMFANLQSLSTNYQDAAEMLVTMNQPLISCRVRHQYGVCHAVYTVGRMKEFEAQTFQGDTELTRREACALMLDYLRLFGDRIRPMATENVPPESNEFGDCGVTYHEPQMALDQELERRVSRGGGGAYNGGGGGNNRHPHWAQSVQTGGGGGFAKPGADSVEPSDTAIQFMNLIVAFKNVRYSQPLLFPKPETVMNTLIEIVGASVVEVTTTLTYDRKGERVGEAKCKYFGAIFTERGDSKEVARTNALVAGYKRLAALYALIQTMQRDYLQSIDDKDDFLFRLELHHESVFKVTPRKTADGLFRATLTLVHFTDFHAEHADAEQAKRLVFDKFLVYMRQLLASVAEVPGALTPAGVKLLALMPPPPIKHATVL